MVDCPYSAARFRPRQRHGAMIRRSRKVSAARQALQREPALHMRDLAAFTSIVLALALSACAAGSGLLRQAHSPVNEPPVWLSQTPAPTARNVLRTRMPALATLAGAAEFDFIVSMQLDDALFQGSGRIVYDPLYLEPLRAERGALIPQSAVFIAPLTSELPADSLPAGMAAIPFAFTMLPEQPAIPASSGELLCVRFRLKQATHKARAVYLLNNAEYLQLRDAQGQRLAFDLETVEAGK